MNLILQDPLCSLLGFVSSAKGSSFVLCSSFWAVWVLLGHSSLVSGLRDLDLGFLPCIFFGLACLFLDSLFCNLLLSLMEI